ncbi:flagella assembly protein FlgT middle domain-containing protein [Silvimonas amylolytica]|uniref:Flagellar assembly protein T middle domain-containing protein n=1 Tax=Silvimonas amylolytica TaxID=449663 RepID=A0ABQ2PRV6_9NEIS|nr:flagella assembly protein FlgT middle domain-containing protein [Silvimonas amylolytica]GGP27689.1 hypothetical protein GCM10010971_35080 [Silvimonas amylolytica]
MPLNLRPICRYLLALGALASALPATGLADAQSPGPGYAGYPGRTASMTSAASNSGATAAGAGQDGAMALVGDQVEAPRCAAMPYKRKVLVTPFWLSQPSQAVDLRQLQGGMQDIFQQRLSRAGGWLTSASKQEVPFDLLPRYDAPVFLPNQVRLLGRQFGTQMVLGGIVHDVSTEGETYRFTHGTDMRPGERKLEADGPIIDFFGIGLKSTPSLRHADIEVFLFDAISGSLITQRRVQAEVSGEILARDSQPVGSAGFMKTDFGKALGKVADQLVAAMQADAACVPFSARVTRVDNGIAYVDAGALSGIAAGDRFQFFRQKAGMQFIEPPGSNPGYGFGLPEDRAGTVTVRQVQAQFAAVGIEKNQAQPGDFVRFAPKPLNQPAAPDQTAADTAPQPDPNGVEVRKLNP